MWTISYLAVAIVSPGIAGDSLTGYVLYATIGMLLFIALGLYIIEEPKVEPLPEGLQRRIYVHKYKNYGRAILFLLAVFEVFGGVASWTGASIWNVPFPNKELFQVSMAFADLLSAVFMLYLAVYND